MLSGAAIEALVGALAVTGTDVVAGSVHIETAEAERIYKMHNR